LCIVVVEDKTRRGKNPVSDFDKKNFEIKEKNDFAKKERKDFDLKFVARGRDVRATVEI
jgi:hypothetical protein